MLELAQTSKAYHERPSVRLRLLERLQAEDVFDPDWVCDCFDNAVLVAGAYVEEHTMKHDEKKHGSFKDYMKRFLDDAPKESDEKETFKKLIGLFGAPVQVKPKD